MELPHALLDRLERAAAPLGVGVVGDEARTPPSSVCSSVIATRLRRARAARPARAARAGSCRARCSRSCRCSAPLEVELEARCRARSPTGRRAPAAPGAKPWSRSTTGSSANERSRSSRIVARCCASAVSMISRASSGRSLESECSAPSSIRAMPGELLHRAVVQEEREPPPLVLLGGDQPSRATSSVTSRAVSRSSLREARSRQPASGCRPRAS